MESEGEKEREEVSGTGKNHNDLSPGMAQIVYEVFGEKAEYSSDSISNLIADKNEPLVPFKGKKEKKGEKNNDK